MINILPNWHPLLVHFTVALLLVAAATHLASHFMANSSLRNQLLMVARWNLWMGAGFTLFTVAAGWVAFYTVAHDAPSHLAMIEHRNWAMVTFTLLLGITTWELYRLRNKKSNGWLFTGLLVVLASLLVTTAWHGGELVYRYGLGVLSLPKPEGSGHQHDHSMPAYEEDTPHADEHDAAADEPPESGGSANSIPNAAQKNLGHSHAPGSAPHKD